MFNALPAANLANFNAFLAGINAYIRFANAHPVRRAVEFGLLDLVPQPFTLADLAAAQRPLVRAFAEGGKEIDSAAFYLRLEQQVGSVEAQGIFNDLFWIQDPEAVVTIPPVDGIFNYPPPAMVSRFNATQLNTIETYASSIIGAATTLDAEISAHLPIELTASNAILVAGSQSVIGKPLLLGGPEIPLLIPSPFWEVSIETTGYNAAGAAFPVVPFAIEMGRNEDSAFTLTVGTTPVNFTYIEKLNPQNQTQYQSGTLNGQPVYSAMDCRQETFKAKGGTPVTQTICRTTHGPASTPVKCGVFFTDLTANVAFSRCNSGWNLDAVSSVGLAQLGATHNPTELAAATAPVAPSWNIFFADTAGDIAYQTAGRYPLPSTLVDPRLPEVGDGSQEWSGFLASTALPSVVNPSQGWLANWNNQPAAGFSSAQNPQFWGVSNHVQGLFDAITNRLKGGAKLDLNALNAINFEAAQRDAFVSRTYTYLANAVAQVPSSDPQYTALNQAVQLIGQWSNKTTQVNLFDVSVQTAYTAATAVGAPLIFPPLTVGGVSCPDLNCNYPDAGAQLYSSWRQQLQQDLFASLAPPSGFDPFVTMLQYIPEPGKQLGDHANLNDVDSLLIHLLLGVSASVPPSCNYFMNCTPINPVTYPAERDTFLVQALREVIEGLVGQPANAVYPPIKETFVPLGPAAFPTSINWMARGNFNVLVDLTGPLSFDVLPPGESGLITTTGPSPHLLDQLSLYSNFKHKPLILGPVTGGTVETIPYTPL